MCSRHGLSVCGVLCELSCCTFPFSLFRLRPPVLFDFATPTLPSRVINYSTTCTTTYLGTCSSSSTGTIVIKQCGVVPDDGQTRKT